MLPFCEESIWGWLLKLDEVDRNDEPPEDILEPDLPIVDPHHHLWPPGYWIPYDTAAMTVDLERGHRITATVFVECMTSFRVTATSHSGPWERRSSS